MRRPLTWVFLALLCSGLSAIAMGCSDNEPSLQGTGDDGNSTGGSSTNTSTSADGGTASGGTAGVSGGGALGTRLGESCQSDRDCATGLTCLRPDRDSLGIGGPAHGWCTLECGVSNSPVENDAVCQEFDASSLCFPFTEDHQYCAQGCMTGVEANKCQGRSTDFMCRPVIHDFDGPNCTSEEDCGAGEGCYNNGAEVKCYSEPTLCVPQCNFDGDCPAGRFCDAAVGLCVSERPTSKRFGESCDPDAAVDECAGFCDPDTSVCEEVCTLLAYPSCGSESTTNGDAICLLAPEAAERGDAGSCAKLCDCNDDCYGNLSCLELADDMGPVSILGRPGICFTAQRGDRVLSECPGAGGAGGQGGSSGDE